MDHSICKNCGSTNVTTFCADCGQKVIEERWTVKRLISSAFSNVFNLEKGFFFTFREMLLRPGVVISDYLKGRTKPYSNPFRFAVIAIAIGVFLSISLQVFNAQMEQVMEMYRTIGIINDAEGEARYRKGLNFVFKFINFIPFLYIPFLGIVSKLFFKKWKRYYAEHLIMHIYVLGQVTLYGIVNTIIAYFFPSFVSYLMLASFLLYGFVYMQVLENIFGKNKLEGFMLGVFMFILAIIIFFFIAFLLGVVIAIFIIIYKKGFSG